MQACRYQQAVEGLGANPVDEVIVAGRRFRVTRIETLLRLSRAGPEGPGRRIPIQSKPPAYEDFRHE
nr:DUF5954 family protein [Micromonospora aurantiaca]